MRPLDPSLVRESGSIRGAIAGTVLCGLLAAAATVVQAGAAAAAISRAFLDGLDLDVLAPRIAVFVAAWTVRALAVTAQDVWARRSGLQAVAKLRERVATGFIASQSRVSGAEALLGRGIDALEIYVAKYLPQLVLAVFVPVGLGIVILRLDWLTAVILIVTIPLIPAFMALIGWFTQDVVSRQWQAVARITDVIVDLFNGLPELVVFGRAQAQARRINELGTAAAHETMRVLRISFLSSLVLELLSTISVAIVAVGIGLRLTTGDFDLETGLFILIIAPDVYLPIRHVGTQFHAAVEGMEAWEQAKQLLAATDAAGRESAEGRLHAVELRDAQVGYDVPLGDSLGMTFTAGRITAVVGPSGVGKTTLLRSIAGLQRPLHGSVIAHFERSEHRVAELDPTRWFAQLAYVPQHAWLGHGTVLEAVQRGSGVDRDTAIAALHRVGLHQLDPDARINDLGAGVSVGQRRRIALARAIVQDRLLLLLDEPTAAVDAESERVILELLRALAEEGRIVIVVAHRRALVQAADGVLEMGARR